MFLMLYSADRLVILFERLLERQLRLVLHVASPNKVGRIVHHQPAFQHCEEWWARQGLLCAPA